MDTHKINIKLFAESDTFKPTEFVPIFHRWIQTQSLDGHLLIDVADYAHVPAGPGTLVVASEANIHMDRGENRLGLLYVRKQPIAGAGTFRQQLRGALIEALKAAAKMEREPDLSGRLKFRTDEISIRLNDRLNAPNTAETFNAVRPDIEAMAKELFEGKPVTIERHDASPLVLLDVRLKSPGSGSVEAVLEKLGAGASTTA
jgi:hypothetical protein